MALLERVARTIGSDGLEAAITTGVLNEAALAELPEALAD
jgi:hypothetical protein